MRLWFARGTEIPLRDQLSTQVILAIHCNDLAPGERLPSTRALARRFGLHPNTVSAAYRQLEKEQWVESRHGSGIYVRQTPPALPPSSDMELDHLIADFFRSARKLGVPLASLRARVQHWFQLQPPDHFLLIEPDAELREILAAEIRSAVRLPVKSCAPGKLNAEVLQGAVPVALARTAAKLPKSLSGDADLLTLQVRSVGESLSEWLPAPTTAIVGVASHWPRFLKLAQTVLLAARFSTECLLLRDARRAGWLRGLRDASVVICDPLTAKRLPNQVRAVVYRLIAEASLAELRRYEAFLCGDVGQ
ncbi:MAG TPA: GntR family transcriptional regulator [Candidatus Limnocylindrales bacterium]|nr:GntR family transcriptional regulator [Candidatus Limnocylindrales bacterium]